MPFPILPIWWRINFRDVTGRQFNILRTVQIFPLVTCTFWRSEERHSWTSVSFGRRSARVGEVVEPSPTYLFLQDWNWSSHSQWDNCINTSGNCFWIKNQIYSKLVKSNALPGYRDSEFPIDFYCCGTYYKQIFCKVLIYWRQSFNGATTLFLFTLFARCL